jgi:hypothetical protein
MLAANEYVRQPVFREGIEAVAAVSGCSVEEVVAFSDGGVSALFGHWIL